MLAAALAFALQAVAPAHAPTDAVAVAVRAWGVCVKRRADAGLRSARPAATLADGAIAGCATALETIRAALAAASGAEAAGPEVDRVRSGTRQMLVSYIERERERAAAASQDE